MLETNKDHELLASENEELRRKLGEAEDTLGAIRDGHIEALIIGDQVYTLQSADSASNRFRGEVLAQINDIVIAVDPDFRITYLNEAAERAYGVRGSEILGLKTKAVFDVRWTVEQGAIRARETLMEKGLWRGEVIHVRNDGSEFDVEAIVSKLDDGDSIMGFLAVIRDITERKRTEEELHQSRLLLEERVEQRTRELAETNTALNQEMKVRATVEKQRTDLLRRIVTSQEDERRRIAQDIHDQLGQRVTALRLQIAAIDEALGETSPVAGKMELLNRTALRLDSEVSFLAWALRPASLDDLGLPQAAKAFLEDWSHNYMISSEFSLRGFTDHRIQAEAETHLYRIMQESLNNVVKHAHATSVSVLLEWSSKDVTLIIEDDGVGFSPTKSGKIRDGQNGLGIPGMHERAVLIGGELQIESVPDEGTTVFARVPHSTKSSVASIDN